MRLTLRTLLAYLDDVLPPEQAKELGQKLTESGYATALVDRIKEVMRRRRLSAPDLFGKGAGIEPNVVAEYLDNELAPNEIADVEKICLDSDVHLAEVAACHQILTLVLGEPVDVRPETRSRMYALGPVAASDTVTVSDSLGKRATGSEYLPIPTIAAAVSPTGNGEVDRALPEYLRPKTNWRRTGLLLVLLLIIIGWIGLLRYDPTIEDHFRPATPNGAAARPSDDRRLAQMDKPEHAAHDDLAPPAMVANESNQPKELVPDLNVPAEETKPVASKPKVVGPIPDVPEVEAASNDPLVKPGKPENLNNAATKPDVARPDAAEDVARKQAEPVPLSASKIVYHVKNEGVLLHFDNAVGDFLRLPRRTELKANDRLACPEPFRSDFAVGDDVCQVALLGGTAVVCLEPNDKASFGFEIAQGALIFEAKGLPPVGDDAAAVDDAGNRPKSLSIAISLRGQQHRLELASDDAFCGLEVRRREPFHFEIEPESPGYSAALHVARGTVRFTTADGKTATVEGPGFLPITDDLTPNVKTSEIGRASQLLLPDWLEADPKRYALKQKRLYNTPFEKEFDPEQPLLLSVPAIVNNPRPAISELAVKCLALTDNYSPLVKALVHAEHREARLATIFGLRQWLPIEARNRQLLRAELARHLLASDAEAIYRLLWGFNHQDAMNPATSRMLVNWLDHEQVAIRELAFWHVQRLTGLKHDYSPVIPLGQRRVAVERWNTHLEKKGGALIQE